MHPLRSIPPALHTPLLLGALALGLAGAGEIGRELLRWDRTALADGEWWRLLTGNLVHLGTAHLLLNLVGLGLVWALVGDGLRGLRGLGVVVLASSAVGLGLWWGEPGLGWYVGLSGTLHGVLVAGALVGSRRRPAESGLVLGLVAVKLAWESLVGPLPGTAELVGGAVISAAHLYGALGGLLTGLGLMAWDRRIRLQSV
jgi:rhomboid family GlyGly-CTERM serine protease